MTLFFCVFFFLVCMFSRPFSLFDQFERKEYFFWYLFGFFPLALYNLVPSAPSRNQCPIMRVDDGV
jgi:hypothetical protein